MADSFHTLDLKPVDWSVIIAGRWNQAILTPVGIAKYVFGMEPSQKLKLEIHVPLDGLSPYQVKHPTEDVLAMTEHHLLKIALTEAGYAALAKAMEFGKNALTRLPETPVLAAGFNIDYRADGALDELAGPVRSEVDPLLLDADFRTKERVLGRTLAFGDGVLKVRLSVSDVESTIRCNFHRETQDQGDLTTWLSTPIEEVRDEVRKLLAALQLPVQEPIDANATERSSAR